MEETATETDKLILCMQRKRFKLTKSKDEQKAKDAEWNKILLPPGKFVLGLQVKRESQDEKDKMRYDRKEFRDRS